MENVLGESACNVEDLWNESGKLHTYSYGRVQEVSSEAGFSSLYHEKRLTSFSTNEPRDLFNIETV